LDADAVSAIYNSGWPIDLTEASGDYDNEGDLVNWWRMGDEDTYDTITDNEGSANGTMTNMSSDDIVIFVPQSNSADLVITPDNLAGGTTLTSNSDARTIMLIWDGSNWQALGEITGTAEWAL
jgi:hypothetical protein